MATISEVQSQIQQRRQQITEAGQEVQSFNPSLNLTQRQLRSPQAPPGQLTRQSPQTRQVMFKEIETRRGQAKKQALSQVREAELQQSQIEQEFGDYLQSDAGKIQTAIESGQTGEPVYQGFRTTSGDIEQVEIGKKFNVGGQEVIYNYKDDPEFAQSLNDFTQEVSASLPSFKSNLQPKPIEDLRGNILLPVKIQKEAVAKQPSAIEKVLGKSLAEPSDVKMSFMKSSDVALPKSTAVLQMPTIGQRVRADIGKATGISIPSASGLYRQLFRDENIPTKISITDVPKDISSSLLRAGTYATGGVQFISSVAGEGATKFATKIGVPTITKTYDLPQQSFFSRGTGSFNPESKQFYVPPPQQFPGDLRRTKEVTVFSPSTIGSATALGVSGIAYTNPYTSTPLLLSSTIESAKQYKQTGKKEDLARTAIIGGLTVLPFAIKGTNYLRTPVTIKGSSPTTVRTFDIKAVSTGEQTIGTVNVIDTTSPQLGITIPRYKVIFAKATTGKVRGPAEVLSKGRIDVTSVNFFGKDDVTKGYGATRKYGPSTTLTKFFETSGKGREITIEELGRLSPVEKYVAKPFFKMSENTNLFSVEGTVTEGINYRGGARLLKTSSGGDSYLTANPKTFGTRDIVALTPRGQKPGDIFVYDVGVSSKAYKSPFPRARGKLSKGAGKLEIKYVNPPSEEGANFIPKGIQKQIPKNVLKQVSSATSKASSLPRPKISRSLIPKATTSPDSYITSPVIVGGLGREVSLYRGGSLIGEISSGSLSKEISMGISSPGKTITSELSNNRIRFETLESEKSNVAGGIKLAFDNSARQRDRLTSAIFNPSATAQSPSITPREFQGNIPRYGIKLGQPQQQAQRTSTPLTPQLPRPTPQIPKPRVPKVPIISKPDDFVKKSKIKSSKAKSLFTPFIRRRGKFIAVGKESTFEVARARGLGAVRQTLGASLQIRESRTGRAVAFAKSNPEFNLGKKGKDPFTLVQRRGRRLSSRGERSEIIRAKKGVNFL